MKIASSLYVPSPVVYNTEVRFNWGIAYRPHQEGNGTPDDFAILALFVDKDDAEQWLKQRRFVYPNLQYELRRISP